jgi:hypothetical protein
MLIAFFPASYGYFVLPTYPSDLAWNGGGGYNHDSKVAYIDQFALQLCRQAASLAHWCILTE